MRLSHLFLYFALILKIAFCQGLGAEQSDEDALTKLIVDFARPYEQGIRDWFWEISGSSYNAPKRKESRADYIGCELCVGALPLVKDLLETGISDGVIIRVITTACVMLNLAPDPAICAPTVQSYAPSVLYILRDDRSASNFCGVLNPGCVPLNGIGDWSISVASEKPLVQPRPEPPMEDDSLVKILQFTDIHLDLKYVVGTNADCPLPVCCRTVNGVPDSPENTAGIFGHFKCGLPSQGLQALYNHAATTHQEARMIFLTGDYVHSGIWQYSVAENSEHIKRVVEMLKTTFAGTEIYPLTGNHEPDVVNMYPPKETWSTFPIRWLYEIVAEPFKDIFPQIELERFLNYGYYSVHSKMYPKLRIIAINSNICYINNFWLAFDPIDTNGQLQWLSNTLALAEKLNEKVYILGHIHPGSGSCWPIWSNQFSRIISRYEGIIKGQFYGHSHEQDYKIAFQPETDRPLSVSYVGGSGVTDGMNSGYNVYYSDGARGADSTWEIINHQTYILNLTNSNAAGVASFDQILDANKDYGLKSLTPEEIFDFINRMVCDDDLFQKYRRVVMKGEDSPRWTKNYCNNTDCKAGILGDLFVSNSADHSNRERFEKHIRNYDCSEQPSDNAPGHVASFFLVIAVVFISTIFQ